MICSAKICSADTSRKLTELLGGTRLAFLLEAEHLYSEPQADDATPREAACSKASRWSTPEKGSFSETTGCEQEMSDGSGEGRPDPMPEECPSEGHLAWCGNLMSEKHALEKSQPDLGEQLRALERRVDLWREEQLLQQDTKVQSSTGIEERLRMCEERLTALAGGFQVSERADSEPKDDRLRDSMTRVEEESVSRIEGLRGEVQALTKRLDAAPQLEVELRKAEAFFESKLSALRAEMLDGCFDALLKGLQDGQQELAGRIEKVASEAAGNSQRAEKQFQELRLSQRADMEEEFERLREEIVMKELDPSREQRVSMACLEQRLQEQAQCQGEDLRREVELMEKRYASAEEYKAFVEATMLQFQDVGAALVGYSAAVQEQHRCLGSAPACQSVNWEEECDQASIPDAASDWARGDQTTGFFPDVLQEPFRPIFQENFFSLS